jgi:hypothetical protein
MLLDTGDLLAGLHCGIIKDGLHIEDEFKECTSDQRGGQVSWQVVMKEQLTTHQIEWEVMGRPRKEKETGRVV